MQSNKKNQPEPPISATDNPGLNRIIERNLRKMIYLRMRARRRRSLHEKMADSITSVAGRMIFVYAHILWFSAWLVVNSGVLGIEPFDPYPFGLLTLVVSLEAIFLSTFILISQNRMSQESEQRSDLDMHINILAEHELTLALQMLDAITTKMGIPTNNKGELADLETSIRPEDVLAKIEYLQDLMK